VDTVETLVLGAGQAGLSVSHCLRQVGHEHVVLERGAVGETWRSERWDSFRLNTPAWWLQLPGHEYDGDEPDVFLTREETVAYLEDYAAKIGGTIRIGVEVTALRRRDDGRFEAETSEGAYTAANVVVATGSFRRPTPRSTGDSPGPFQLHASAYRNPDQLPDGGVLVVGSGQTGCQIGAELLRAGRDVYLSVGRCPSLPFWYRGRSLYRWYVESGVMDDTVDTLPSPAARLGCNPTISSDDVPHLAGPRRLARGGATLLGRLEALDERRAVFAGDANQRLAESDGVVATFMRRFDEHAAGSGDALPAGDAGAEQPREVPEVREVDLREAGIGTVLWANGWRPDYSWIELPIFDEHGWPRQTRGRAEVDGLYFVGLHWLHRRKSTLLLGVAEDAAYVASAVVANGRRERRAG
jgi:putative flavoprotein involved in K+ transport